MKPEFQRRIQRYGWDKAATYYNTGWQDQLWSAQRQLIAETDFKESQSVLDISCGTGLVTFPIAEQVGPDGLVTGIDLSEKMIDQAVVQAEQKSIKNVRFTHMDAESLDFPDNHFDAVICSLGLMYFPFPEKALKEMYRVVKPGGRASALVWGARKNCGWAGIFPIVDKRVSSDVCPMFFRLGTGDVLQSIFQAEVGFKEVNSMKFSPILHFKDGKQACIAAFWGGAVALAYNKFDDKLKAEVDKEYLESISKHKNGSGYNIPAEFVIADGIKA